SGEDGEGGDQPPSLRFMAGRCQCWPPLRPASEAFSGSFLKLPPDSRPPFAAISRCLSWSIDANPRFEVSPESRPRLSCCWLGIFILLFLDCSSPWSVPLTASFRRCSGKTGRRSEFVRRPAADTGRDAREIRRPPTTAGPA